MATAIGTGFDLSGLQQAIKKAEDNLKKLETTNKNVVESIGNFWKKIGEQGLDSYLLSLEKQKKVLKDIASIRFDDKAPEALKKYGENASKSIDQLNTLIDSLNKLKKQSVITQSSSKLQAGNTDYWNWEKQQMEDNLVAYRKNKEEKIAIQEAYKQEYIQGITKMFADEEAKIKERKNIQRDYYNYTTQLLIENAKQSKSIGSQIFESEKAYHQQRQAFYEKLFSLQSKYIQEASLLSAKVYNTTNGGTWNASAEGVILQNQKDLQERRDYITQRQQMYESMFDTLERRERQMLDDINRYNKSKFDEELEQYRKSKEDQLKIDKQYYEQRQSMYEKLFSLQAKYLNEAGMMAARVYNRTDGQTWGANPDDIIKKNQDELRQRAQYLQQMEQMYAKMWDSVLAKESKVDEERYQLWLMRKDSEEKEHKRIEDAKLKATQDAIAKQNAEYAKAEALRNAQAKTNQQTKDNSAKIKSERDAMYKMYEQMFDNIAKKNGQTAEQIIKKNQEELRQRKKYIDEMTNMYARMFDEIAKKESQNRASKYGKIQATGDTSNQALAAYNRLYSYKGVKSINNMNAALQRLRDAQSKLNLKTEDGKKKYDKLGEAIKHIEKDMAKLGQQSENVKKKHSNLLNISGQLQRRLALVFSVSQITGYINKIIQVRGEFELQQRALQAIVQNVDEANKLWDKTVALAVKSPFRVKELVTYTKQLAAYRIETSKLYDTTKILADVSAGLGVDMNRLILAYGQVRAANFLRGTELRQFSEAGIPMLEELAKHFTELEGRAISVGDVFERISKRMVTFEDVSAVFQQMTNEGGVFYDMQAKQSETLKGQISNLHDAIDLMMNDIGKATDGVLKNSVSFARSFVENWREIAFHIEKVVVALASWKIANAAYILGTKKSATTTLLGNKALKANIGSTLSVTQALTWHEAKILGVTKAQFAMGKATLYVQGALRGVGLAMKTILPIAVIAGMFELYRIMTKASREARMLQEDLNNIYNEDTSNLETQTKTFKDLVERIKNVNKGSKEHSAIISELNNKYGDYLGFLVTEKTTYDELKNSIDGVVNALSKKAQMNTLEKALSTITESTTKDILSLQNTITEGLKKGLVRESGGEMLIPSKREINDFFALYKQKTEELGRTLSRDETNKLLSSYFKEDVMITGYTYFEKYKDLGETILKQKEKEAEVQEQINSLYGEGVYSSAEARVQYEKLTKEKEKELANTTSRIEKEKIERKYAEAKIKLDVQFEYDNLKEDEQNRLIEYRINELNKKANSTIKDINRRLIESTDELGKDVVDRIYITAQDEAKGISGIAESFAQAYKSNQEIIKQEKALNDAGTVYDEKRIQDAEKLSKGYYKVLEIMGRIDLLEDKKDKNKKEDEVKEQIDLIKKMHEEYVKLNQDYDSAEAKQKVLNAYTKLWGEHFSKVGVNLKSRTIDAEKLKNVLSDASLSDDFKNQLKELSESGNYIRTFSDSFVEQIKKSEGFIAKARDIGDGVYTFGYGDTIGVKKGDKITKQEADLRLRNRLTRDYAKDLNSVLDVNKDLILTQEQYNTLLDLTYQGGKGAVMNLVKYARNEDEAIKHISNIYEKVKNVFGEEDAERFGEAFITKFKEAENIYERISMLLQTMNLTVKGEQISKDLYKGMQKRSDERSAGFLMGKEFTDALLSATVESSAFDFTTKQGVASFLSSLRNLAGEEGEKIKEVLELAISQFTAEIGVDLKVEEDKRLFDRIEDIFGNYEVSLELEKLNIPSDLAKRLFGIDPVSLDDIRGQILDNFNLSNLKEKTNQEIFDSDEFKNLSKKRQNEVRESLKKEDELQQKALEERLKRYSQYIVKGQSEAVQLKISELRELAKLEEDYQNKRIEMTKTDYELAKKGIQDKYQKKENGILWDEFKETDTYIRIFEDLDSASSKSLSRMNEKLNSLRDSLNKLDPEQLKEIVRLQEQIKNEQIERNPFSAIISSAKELIELQKERADLEDKYNYKSLEEVEDSYSSMKEKFEIQQAIVNAKREGTAKEGDIIQFRGKDVKLTNESLESEEEKLKALSDEYVEIKRIYELYVKLTNKEESAINGIQSGFSEAASMFNSMSSSVSELASSFDKLGIGGQELQDIMSTTSEVLGGLGTMFEGGAMLASGNPFEMVAGGMKMLSGLGNTIASLWTAGDKKNEREIQAEINLVNKLEHQYKKLEKAIDEAYEIDTLKSSYDQAQANLDQQIAAYNNMIEAERDKKDSDSERIAEWERAQEELEQAKEDLKKSTVEDLGGNYDYKSATREFVDAWLEAFNETGNGMDGLKKHFKSFWKEIVLNQVVQGGATKIMKPLIDAVNTALEDDFKINDSEEKMIDSMSETVMKNLDEYMKVIQEKYGDLLSETDTELSGLQRGIQGITEDQADVLASYLNSIRMFVSSNNQLLAQLVNLQGGVASASVAENPMLPQLRIVAQQTTAIRTLLDSVVKTVGHSKGGAGIKVFMS